VSKQTFQPPLFDPSHSNHPRRDAAHSSRADLESIHLCLTVSQFILKIHQIIIAYHRSTIQPDSSTDTNLKSRQGDSIGAAPPLALRHACVLAPVYSIGTEHLRQPTRWRLFRMFSRSYSVVPSKRTRAPSHSTLDSQMKQPHHQASSSQHSVQTMHLTNLSRPWQSTTSVSVQSLSMPATI
jgi:hypothetical protein